MWKFSRDSNNSNSRLLGVWVGQESNVRVIPYDGTVWHCKDAPMAMHTQRAHRCAPCFLACLPCRLDGIDPDGCAEVEICGSRRRAPCLLTCREILPSTWKKSVLGWTSCLPPFLVPRVSYAVRRVSMASGCQELRPVLLTIGVTALLANLDL